MAGPGEDQARHACRCAALPGFNGPAGGAQPDQEELERAIRPDDSGSVCLRGSGDRQRFRRNPLCHRGCRARGGRNGCGRLGAVDRYAAGQCRRPPGFAGARPGARAALFSYLHCRTVPGIFPMACRSAAMAVVPGELRNSGRTMKIAFVMHDYRRAGVGQTRYVKELAERFSQEHEVHVFANHIESEGSENIHFHHVPAWRKNLLTTVLTFAATSTFEIGQGFDVIHSQGFCGFYGNVFTAHICNRAWHVALRKFEGGVTPRELIFNSFATVLEYTAYRPPRKSAVIAVSERVADDIRKYYHCPAPMHVIYHGVNLELFSPDNRRRLRPEARRKLGVAESEFVFLFAGQLRKGVGRCIQALARLGRGQLVCVSPSPSDPYHALVEQLGLKDRVQFCSFSDRVESFY